MHWLCPFGTKHFCRGSSPSTGQTAESCTYWPPPAHLLPLLANSRQQSIVGFQPAEVELAIPRGGMRRCWAQERSKVEPSKDVGERRPTSRRKKAEVRFFNVYTLLNARRKGRGISFKISANMGLQGMPSICIR